MHPSSKSLFNMHGQTNSPSPSILIVGASARAAAFSALRAGLQPICADLFGDVDLRNVADVTVVEDFARDVPAFLTRHPGIPWMYTGGIENLPRRVGEWERLCDGNGGALWGNSESVLRRVRDPFLQELILSCEGLPALENWKGSESPPRDGCWIRKPIRGAGGRGIVVWDEHTEITDPRERCYFQRRASGVPISGLFVTVGERTVLLGTALQLIGTDPAARQGFAYCGSVAPLELEPGVKETVRAVGELVGRKAGLRGLFGCDFVLDGETPWLTEVNPRYTASVELFEYALRKPLLNWHAAAFRPDGCDAGLEDALSMPPAPIVFGKSICYTEQDLIAPEFAVGNLNRNGDFDMPERADLPEPGSTIPAGTPVCSRFASAESVAACLSALSIRPNFSPS